MSEVSPIEPEQKPRFKMASASTDKLDKDKSQTADIPKSILDNYRIMSNGTCFRVQRRRFTGFLFWKKDIWVDIPCVDVAGSTCDFFVVHQAQARLKMCALAEYSTTSEAKKANMQKAPVTPPKTQWQEVNKETGGANWL